MTKFTIDIADDRLLAGIAYAREMDNATLEKPVTDDAVYLGARVADLCESWAQAVEAAARLEFRATVGKSSEDTFVSTKLAERLGK